MLFLLSWQCELGISFMISRSFCQEYLFLFSDISHEKDIQIEFAMQAQHVLESMLCGNC